MGMGKPDGVFAQPKSGLGTGIVKALAKQLDSQVVTSSGKWNNSFGYSRDLCRSRGTKAPDRRVPLQVKASRTMEHCNE